MVRISKHIDEIIRKKRDAPQRSNSTKVSALSMLKSGLTQRKVSERLGIPMRTLRDWKAASIKSGKWNAGGDAGLARPAPRKINPGSGFASRKVTEKMKRRIKHLLNINPFLTPYGLQLRIPGLKNVTLRTIQHVILKELNIPSRIAAKNPHLTEAQKTRRLGWADRHRRWSQVKWARVLFSDETHIEQWVGSNQCKRVCRSSSISRYNPNFILRTVKFPPKLMIWGAVGNGKLGDIYFVEPNEKMNARMYTEVLQRHLKRSMQKTGCSIFMQDGAPCHKAKSVMEWLADHNVSVLKWVGQSCDANPIENLWTKLKKIIRSFPATSNLQELKINIKRGWKELAKDTDYLERICNSMTNRVEAIIASEGDVTKY